MGIIREQDVAVARAKRGAVRLHEELNWAVGLQKGKSDAAEVCRMSLSGTFYHIWLEEESEIFPREEQNSREDHKVSSKRSLPEEF